MSSSSVAEIMNQNAHVDDFSVTDSQSSSFDSSADCDQSQTGASKRRDAGQSNSFCTPLKMIFGAGALLAGAGVVAVLSGACESSEPKPSPVESKERDTRSKPNLATDGSGAARAKGRTDSSDIQEGNANDEGDVSFSENIDEDGLDNSDGDANNYENDIVIITEVDDEPRLNRCKGFFSWCLPRLVLQIVLFCCVFAISVFVFSARVEWGVYLGIWGVMCSWFCSDLLRTGGPCRHQFPPRASGNGVVANQ